MNTKKNLSIFFNFARLIEILLLIILSLAIYFAQNITTTKAVFIPKGNISEIISYLDKQNFKLSPTIDKYFVRLIGKPQAGWIEMGKTSMSRGDFLYRLTKAKAYTKQVIIYPGETIDFVLKTLASEYKLSLDELRENYEALAPFEDGVIMAETYNIPVGISERHLIGYLVNSSLYQHKKMSKKIFKEYDQKKWKHYLTIASIIQKEAGNNEEMPLVSSVVHNRLKKGMKLQMDGALNYGKYSHIKITPKRIKEDETRFNTYKYEGLPPYPVCAVSVGAIKAAISPAKSEYLYFMRDKSDKSKGHVFTKTYAEHIKEIKRQRKL